VRVRHEHEGLCNGGVCFGLKAGFAVRAFHNVLHTADGNYRDNEE
jgi:hypothetical protein